MKASSISLAAAAVLTVASLSSATAGVTITRAWPNRVPPMGMAAPPMNPAVGRFGPFGQNGFRHGWGQPAPFVPLGVGAVVAPGLYPAEGGQPPAPPIIWAPIEVTLAAPGCAYGYPQAAAIGGGPRIITIGAPSRSARSRKMPIVIYGTGGGQAY